MKKSYPLYYRFYFHFNKEATLFITCLLMNVVLWAQATSNISGIVNTYHKVVEIIPSQGCVRVTNAAALNINTMVMVIQMKGASIVTANNSSFGDTTTLNEAGNYEVGTICNISGDSVYLFHNLLNTYNTVSGKVQLVQFAAYYAANIVDTVKAQAWDSTAGTGGVIAIFANQDIVLNAPIFADAAGYRGGNYSASNGTCGNVVPATGYVYDASNTSPQNGAYKGEGIANLNTAQTGGRGALANGGGGGNNHNNSGGGGANLTSGGKGGGNSSSSGCRTTIQGEAGKALSNWGGKKIFMGGGGGAGHNNNAVYTLGGANGGGIIFIWANNITGNGKLISASGGTGGQSVADGAGGGGAGGSIILNVGAYTGSAFVKADGGNGGASNDGGNIGLCYGGGGGGSGGVVYFSGALPAITTTINGGAGGIESGRDPGCNAAVPGLPGANGSVFANYAFARSTNQASQCKFLLPVHLLSFSASPFEKKVILRWKVENPELARYYTVEKLNILNAWTSVVTLATHAVQEEYSSIDNNPATGKNIYRLKIIQKNNSITYSEIKEVVINSSTAGFSIYPNPATNKITISGNFNPTSKIILLDVLGKIVFVKQLTGNSTDIILPPLSPGIYLLRINENVQKLFIY